MPCRLPALTTGLTVPDIAANIDACGVGSDCQRRAICTCFIAHELTGFAYGSWRQHRRLRRYGVAARCSLMAAASVFGYGTDIRGLGVQLTSRLTMRRQRELAALLEADGRSCAHRVAPVEIDHAADLHRLSSTIQWAAVVIQQSGGATSDHDRTTMFTAAERCVGDNLRAGHSCFATASCQAADPPYSDQRCGNWRVRMDGCSVIGATGSPRILRQHLSGNRQRATVTVPQHVSVARRQREHRHHLRYADQGRSRQIVTLIFTGTPPSPSGSNLKLLANLVATADDAITICLRRLQLVRDRDEVCN